MRGRDIVQESLFTCVRLETFVPDNHPLRFIKPIIDKALRRISGVFDPLYSAIGRESIPPERLIRAQLLEVLFSIRSERLLVEQIHHDMLYRWFVGLTIDDEVWDHSTFSVQRRRLMENDVIPALFKEVVDMAYEQNLLSDEHFSVDGTLIQAWASQKSIRRKDDDSEPPADEGRNRSVDFHGEKRTNQTHESKTDPEALLAKKGAGKEAKLSYMGHTLMENRNGLIVNAKASQATGTAERDTAIEMLTGLPGRKRRTVGADKNYDTAKFVEDCRENKITPHVARNDKRKGGSAIDGRTSEGIGYAISQRCRKRVEEPFGWGKTIGLIRQVKVRGLKRVNDVFIFTMMGWNLTRMSNLQHQSAR